MRIYSPRISVTVAAIACGIALPLHALDPNKTIDQFSHTAWSAKDGIPGPVKTIAQTSDGYLWLGTPSGLYRYDGMHFLSWEPAPGDEKLPRPSISALLAARDGSLWIGFPSGPVGRLRNGRLRTYDTGDGLSRGVLTLAEGQDGSIWAGGEHGLDRFENEKWTKADGEFGYPAPGAQRLGFDRRGTLWVATTGLSFGLSDDNVRVNTILKLPVQGASGSSPPAIQWDRF